MKQIHPSSGEIAQALMLLSSNRLVPFVADQAARQYLVSPQAYDASKEPLGAYAIARIILPNIQQEYFI